MTQVLKHLKNSTIADGPDPTQVNPSDWNAAHVFSAGALGSLLMRDTGDATYGASWLASVAAGSVLVSNGVGAAPSWAASLTLGGNLTVGGLIAASGIGTHALVANASGVQVLLVRNLATGAATYSVIQVGNDLAATTLQVISYASTVTFGAPSYPNSSEINQAGAGLTLNASNAAGKIELWTAGAKRWTFDNSGFFFTGTGAPGNVYTTLLGGGIQLGNSGTTAANVALFVNANGTVGSIQTTGSATAYLTSSDARLKTDRGLARSTAVLEQTEIHEYDWIADGRPGRGVFSQDAHRIAPFANAPGSDERDEAGRLVRPWATDYSKYVPDLIVGWQQHKARLEALADALKAVLARG